MRLLWGTFGWVANAVRILAAAYLWFMYFQLLSTFLSGGFALIISILVYPGLLVVPFFDERMQGVDGYSLGAYVGAIFIAIIFGDVKNWCFEKRRWA